MNALRYMISAVLLAMALGIWVSDYRYYRSTFSSDHILSVCGDVENKALCFTDNIERVLGHEGVGSAFDVLADIYDRDGAFYQYCHANTHEIGKRAYEQFKTRGSVDLAPNAYACGYGFYHGFMEELMVDTNDIEDARAFCEWAGTEIPEPVDYTEGACYHGIGHGVTDGKNTQLYGDALRMAAPGLAMCKRVANEDIWLHRCASGVFNALALMYREPVYRLSALNPYEICWQGEYEPLIEQSCYEQMNTLAMYMAGNDFGSAFDFALAVEDESYRSIAVRYISTMVLSRKNTDVALPLEEMNERLSDEATICLSLPAFAKNDCLQGLIEGIWEFGPPGRQWEFMLTMCALPALQNMGDLCYGHLVRVSSFFFPPETMTAICARLPEEYISLCRG